MLFQRSVQLPKNETEANIDICPDIFSRNCGFLCKFSTYNQEAVLTLNVHVGDEIAHANKMAADNLDCNLAKKIIVSAKTFENLKTNFMLANN